MNCSEPKKLRTSSQPLIANMTRLKFTSVDVTPQPSMPKRKWLEYRVNDVAIGHAHTFLCNGRFNAGRLGRTFDWNHDGLKAVLGAEKYNANRDRFVSPRADLVYGTGATIPLKCVKEIFTAVVNSL